MKDDSTHDMMELVIALIPYLDLASIETLYRIIKPQIQVFCLTLFDTLYLSTSVSVSLCVCGSFSLSLSLSVCLSLSLSLPLSLSVSLSFFLSLSSHPLNDPHTCRRPIQRFRRRRTVPS